MNKRVSASPRRVVVVATLFACLLLPLPVRGQDSTSLGQTTDQTTEAEKYLNKSIDLETGTDTGALRNLSANTSKKQVSSSGSSVSWYLAKTLAVLVVLSVAVWGILKFLKKSGFGGASNKFMSIHSTLAVGQNQYLQIVQVGKQFFMIGVTDKNVNMLGEITDSETVTDLQLNGGASEDQQNAAMNNFGEMFNQFVGTAQHGFTGEDDEQQTQQESQLSDLKNKIENLRESGGQA